MNNSYQIAKRATQKEIAAFSQPDEYHQMLLRTSDNDIMKACAKKRLHEKQFKDRMRSRMRTMDK